MASRCSGSCVRATPYELTKLQPDFDLNTHIDLVLLLLTLTHTHHARTIRPSTQPWHVRGKPAIFPTSNQPALGRTASGSAPGRHEIHGGSSPQQL